MINNLEIRIYDSSLNFLGVIDSVSSFQWHRKYYEPGNVEMHCPVTKNNLSLLSLENIVYLVGSVEAAVIEGIVITSSESNEEIKVTGRFLSSYMDRRLIRPYFHTENGNTETAMRNIFLNAVAIPNVELANAHGFAKSITFQATYKNLLVYEEKLAKYLQAGIRFRPDFSAKKIYFELYAGVNRTLSQSDVPRVVFSDEYNNLTKISYTNNEQLYSNVCYVGGQGEGENRTYVIAGDDSLTGLERREVFLSSSDVSPNNQTDEQYKASLKQRGDDKLNNSGISLSVEASVNPIGNFIYKTDYDLGDLVTIKNTKFGINIDERITEVTEIYEGGAFSVFLTFGTPIPETIDWTDAIN